MNFLPYMPLVHAYDFDFRPEARAQRPVSSINPLEFYGEEEFRKRCRFSRATFQFICDLLGDELGSATKRHWAPSTAEKLCIALRFYATGNMLEVVGDTLRSVSKSFVSPVVRDVSLALSRKLDQFVYFSNNGDELRRISIEFKGIANFPRVVGAVDGTHIRFQAPTGDQEPYYVNRKGYHSLNVQAMRDANGAFKVWWQIGLAVCTIQGYLRQAEYVLSFRMAKGRDFN